MRCVIHRVAPVEEKSSAQMPALRVGQYGPGRRPQFIQISNCFDVENAAVDGPHASQNCTGEIPVATERHGDPQANLYRRYFSRPNRLGPPTQRIRSDEPKRR